MEWFDKATHYALMAGFGALGALAAMCVIQIAPEVVEPILLVWIAYHWYNRYYTLF